MPPPAHPTCFHPRLDAVYSALPGAGQRVVAMTVTSRAVGGSVSLRSRRVNGYEGARPDVQALVPIDATRILELGCSSGRLGAVVKARLVAHAPSDRDAEGASQDE